MSKVMSLVIVFSLLISCQISCSAFVSGTQRINIVTSEPDAKIFVNGQYVGKGRVTTRVPRNENLSVMATTEGYIPVTRNIGTKMSTTGILDIIGGCIILVPFFGLLFPGAHELDESNISITMEKASSPSQE